MIKVNASNVPPGWVYRVPKGTIDRDVFRERSSDGLRMPFWSHPESDACPARGRDGRSVLPGTPAGRAARGAHV